MGELQKASSRDEEVNYRRKLLKRITEDSYRTEESVELLNLRFPLKSSQQSSRRRRINKHSKQKASEGNALPLLNINDAFLMTEQNERQLW